MRGWCGERQVQVYDSDTLSDDKLGEREVDLAQQVRCIVHHTFYRARGNSSHQRGCGPGSQWRGCVELGGGGGVGYGTRVSHSEPETVGSEWSSGRQV